MFATRKKATTHDATKRTTEYASASEFCQIFSKNMEALYTLALSLTADKASAEECLLSALDDCQKSASVFRQWAHSWSRLAVIESAIRMVKPSANGIAEEKYPPTNEIVEIVDSAGALLSKLRPFDRFTFVLSVLDRYSVRDCAILLKCRPMEIRRARERAMEFISKAGDLLAVPMPLGISARLTA